MGNQQHRLRDDLLRRKQRAGSNYFGQGRQQNGTVPDNSVWTGAARVLVGQPADVATAFGEQGNVLSDIRLVGNR